MGPVMTTAAVTSNHKGIVSFRKWAKGRRQQHLSIPLNPVPASRPRVTRWGVHYTKTYAKWKKQAGLYLPQGYPTFPGQKVCVLAEHWVQRPKTTKLESPRGDVDNYLKATLDAITSCGAVWTDDDQVVLVLSTKEYATEEPRTDVLVVEL